jgi:hypothetical protein
MELIAVVLLLLAAGAQAAPKAELWERWTAHDETATASIDHSAWTAFIQRYREPGPDGVARLDYGAVSPSDRGRLEAYIERLASVTVGDYPRAEQFAYWVNLYNALTVQVILDHYPVDSIRDIDISPGWFSNGPWGRKLVTIEGTEVSLDDIEHRILRPIWRDPRIHYAVNCASIGCPNLQPEAFTADNSARLLERGADEYVNHPRGATFDDGGLIVSSIYDWFQADFGGTERGVIEHLQRHADDALAARLEGREAYDGHRYDWALNDVP